MSCKPTPKHSPFHQLWRTVKKLFRVIAFLETNFLSMLGSYRMQKSCFLSLYRANKHTQKRLLLKLASKTKSDAFESKEHIIVHVLLKKLPFSDVLPESTEVVLKHLYILK